jgi:hypothetical protein
LPPISGRGGALDGRRGVEATLRAYGAELRQGVAEPVLARERSLSGRALCTAR